MPKCTQCGASVKAGWKTCPRCGSSLAEHTCPSCGRQIKMDWRHCPHCGGAIGADVPVLPTDAELDTMREGRVSGDQIAQAQRLLRDLRRAVDGIAEQQKYRLGGGFRALFRGMPELDEHLDEWTSLHDEFIKVLDIDICDSCDSPWGKSLTRKKTPEPAEFVDTLRRELRWLEDRLEEAGGDVTRDQGSDRPASADRFTCPGCGQPATAKNASLCPNCQQYVHHDCALKGFVNWSCPVCESGLIGQS